MESNNPEPTTPYNAGTTLGHLEINCPDDITGIGAG